jgi:hypothetical protein
MFHEYFGPIRSQIIGIDRGPERVVVESIGAPDYQVSAIGIRVV